MLENLQQWTQKKVQSIAMHLRGRYFRGEVISSAECWDGIRHCLIVNLDNPNSVDNQRIVLERLKDRFEDAKLTLVTDEAVGEDYLRDSVLQAIVIDDSQISYWGIPKKELREKISGLGVEVAIDMSPEFDPLTAYFCMLSRARLRIGFAGPQSDLPFNFQIAPQRDRRGKELYRVMARYIG